MKLFFKSQSVFGYKLTVKKKIDLRGMLFIFLCIGFFNGCTRKEEFKNEVNFFLRDAVKSLDPATGDEFNSSTAISQTLETLYHYHYLKRPLETVPLLADGMPQITNDGRTYTIKIKKGVFFHDDPSFPNGKGRELEAKDFIYGWKRVMDPTIKTQGRWIFEDKVKGFKEWSEKMGKGLADYDTPVPGLKALDKYTLQIDLEKPYFQLLYILTLPYTSPMAKEVVEKYGAEIGSHPVGTGPFILTEWIRGNKLVYKRNPNYHEVLYPSEGENGDKEKGLLKDAGKRLPFVDQVVIHILIEDQTQWLSFLKGQVDSMVIPKDNYSSVILNGDLSKELKEQGVSINITTEPDVTYVALNQNDPILGKNDKLRKAMSMAYNSDLALEKFYNKRGEVAQSIIPPTVDGYDPKFKNPYKEFNLEKAKSLLAEAGYPGGVGLPDFDFAVTSSSTARQLGEYFQLQMKNIGINIKISVSSWPQFTKKLRDNKGQIWGIAWVADYPDAENFLSVLYGKNLSPGPNAAMYQNPEYDKLFLEAAGLPPGEERNKIYHKMRDILSEDMPIIPLVHRKGYRLVRPWLSNFKRHIAIADFIKYWRIDVDKKKEMKSKL